MPLNSSKNKTAEKCFYFFQPLRFNLFLSWMGCMSPHPSPLHHYSKGVFTTFAFTPLSLMEIKISLPRAACANST